MSRAAYRDFSRSPGCRDARRDRRKVNVSESVSLSPFNIAWGVTRDCLISDISFFLFITKIARPILIKRLIKMQGQRKLFLIYHGEHFIDP